MTLKLQTTIRRECTVQKTPRFVQVAGKFELSTVPTTVREWEADIQLPPDWQVLVIVGPSMAGKNSVADELFPGELVEQGSWNWPADQCIADGFPADMPLDDICRLLSSVGFSSPPDWMKPYGALSNGGKFRVDLARTIAERVAAKQDGPRRAVIDEFGSLVHAEARKIAAAAASKTIRRLGGQLVALLLHEDAIEYFEPDVVIRINPGEKVTAQVTRGLLRRPDINLEVVRTDSSAWELFRHHHYLSHSLNKTSKCFVGLIDGRPATFTAVISFPHAKRPGWQEHRTVCMPDYQGIGIGNRASDFVGSLFKGSGKPYRSTTTHPAMIQPRRKNKNWKMTRKPSLQRRHSNSGTVRMAATTAVARLTAGFEYIGPARPVEAKGFGLAVSA